MAGTARVDKREIGLPGGGAGRKDEVRGSGVYRVSGPQPKGDAPIVGMASWGQGARGAEGYNDYGESQIFYSNVAPEKCRDIMTKEPFCCVPADTAAQAARLMKRHDIGVLPVVEDRAGRKLLGVVTDRDLALRVVARAIEPSGIAVKLAMSRPVIRCSPDDPYQTAIDLMEKHRVKRVFVTDQSGRLVGVIAESDIALRLHDPAKTGEVVECVAQPDPVRA